MTTDREPAPIPWRRAFALLRPLRGGVLAMGGLTVSGVLIGLVPPLLFGVLINALVAQNATAHAALLASVIAVAMVLEAGAYVASDGMYARNASRLYRNLRLLMFGGALRQQTAAHAEGTAGLPSRFISDAETLERATLALLDQGLMQIVEFVTTLVALAVLEPWTIAVVLPSLAATWLIARRVQEPAAVAGQHRQEQLEAMTSTLSRLLASRSHGPEEATSRFRAATERVMTAEVRLGWLRALNLQGSGGLAKLGSITPVLAAALAGRHHAGTLMAIYLLAQRVFWSFDGLVDLRLDAQSVRGAVARCFELIDIPASPAIPVHLASRRGAHMGYGTLDAAARRTTCAASEATQNPCRTSLFVSRVTNAT
jgi:ABC-type multidrug transport system fused ATPase/permease subunit